MDANLVVNKQNPSDLTLEEFDAIPVQQFDKLNILDVLDYINPEQLMEKLFKIKSKLKPNAKITIQGYDIYELCSAIVEDKMPTIDFNNIIKDRKQLLSIPDLLFILNHLKFKILGKDIDASKFLIEAQNVEQ